MAGRRIQQDSQNSRERLGTVASTLEEIPVIGDVVRTLRGRAKDASGKVVKSKRQQALDDAMNQ